MTQPYEINARERRRRERPVWRIGVLVSILFHAVLFFGWKGSVIPESPFAAAGPRAGDRRAAAGAMQAINVRTRPTIPIIPPPLPIEVEVEIEPIDFEQAVEIDAAAILGEQPGLIEGPGLDGGTGAGDGGNAEEGLYRPRKASPQGIIIPPSNKELRGTEVVVRVFVNEQGRVVADSTRLDPPTRDGGFNRTLIREASDWVFRPAVHEGKPIASWFSYRIQM
jgi:hypothetical protein